MNKKEIDFNNYIYNEQICINKFILDLSNNFNSNYKNMKLIIDYICECEKININNIIIIEQVYNTILKIYNIHINNLINNKVDNIQDCIFDIYIFKIIYMHIDINNILGLSL